MVLIIDDQEVSSLKGDEVFDQFPGLRKKSSKLVEKRLREVKAEERCVYVGQREVAVAGPEDRVEMLGSEDATTCHIVVLRDSNTNTTGLAHLDTEEPEQFLCMEREVAARCASLGEAAPHYDLAIIGGYSDERGTSVSITNTLLDLVISSQTVFRLEVAVMGELNTEYRAGIAWPRVYGGGVLLSTGEIFTATFSDHGPDPDIRSLLSHGVETLHNIYDSESDEIVLQYHRYSILRNPEGWLAQSDQFLLSHLSTSPAVEPPDFCDNLRKTFLRMISDPRPLETLFPGGRSRRYSREPTTGLWKLKQ